MKALLERIYPDLTITQDLGLGMIVWMSHSFPRKGGQGFIMTEVWPCWIECGSTFPGISAGSRDFRTSSSLSPISVSPSAFRRLAHGLFGWHG